MLSGEGSENGENTTIGLISKQKQLYTCSTLLCPFLCRCFARLPGYTIYGGNVVRVFSFFFFSLSFFSPWLPLTLLIFSPLLQNFMLFLQQKMSPLFFLSSSSSFSPALSLLASRPTFAFSLSLILFLYIPHLRT